MYKLGEKKMIQQSRCDISLAEMPQKPNHDKTQ